MRTRRPLSQVMSHKRMRVFDRMHCIHVGFFSYKSPDDQGVPQDLFSIKISLMEYKNCVDKFSLLASFNVLGEQWDLRP